MKKYFVLLVFLTSFIRGNSQLDTLYALDARLMSGDITALKRLASFFDSKKQIVEYLGYHRLTPFEESVAKRILRENCLFTEQELKIDSSLSSRKFISFLESRKGQIKFDEYTGTFLITPLTNRQTKYQLLSTNTDYASLTDSLVWNRPYPGWVFENQIDGFINKRDPQALLWIASTLYKTKARFNRYDFNTREYIELMRALTGTEVGVPDDRGKLTFLYESDYESVAKLNYLIYWANHYQDYEWSNQQNRFINTKERSEQQGSEAYLFSLLKSENDTIAKNAFLQLVEMPFEKIKPLSDENERSVTRANFELPTFPYRFINQISLLTAYCRENKIEYKARSPLKESLDSLLNNKLHFEIRYKLEDRIIDETSLEDVTCIEYFGLVNQKNWNGTYSIGRILDKFYSRNWQEILKNERRLSAYLKKSRLFAGLGIIGICGKYLRKFENISSDGIDFLKQVLKTQDDLDVRQQAETAIKIYSLPIPRKLREKKRSEGNDDYIVNDLLGDYNKIIKSKQGLDEKRNELKVLIGKISYEQIGQAIKILQKDTVLKDRDKFYFLRSDFGFYLQNESEFEIEKFLRQYSTLSEKELYEKYLTEMQIEYISTDGELNFQKIYDVLKFDIVDAFAGGGGSRREDGVYLLIKLLELNFKTTHDFPKKRCNWQGMWGCTSDDRAKYWMKFLEEKGFAKPNKLEPGSISYND